MQMQNAIFWVVKMTSHANEKHATIEKMAASGHSATHFCKSVLLITVARVHLKIWLSLGSDTNCVSTVIVKY